ncbi:MAG: hypothetical protein DRI36_01840 [Caldiserica bacterium]|nr:MAG: hypothetical protein DRI36_01840 [Caldisericota bacterium]
MRDELKIGIFVFFALLIFAFGVIILGDVHLKKGYVIKIVFDDTAGLSVGSAVRIAGVEVGKVSKIYLSKDGKAVVEAWIRGDVRLRSDARAEILSTGVIGTKYLELSLGKEGKFLKDGDLIYGESPESIEKIGARIVNGINKVVELFTEEEGGKLKDVIDDVSKFFSKLNEEVDENDVRETIKNFKKFSDALSKIAEKRGDIEKSIEDLPAVIDELRENMKRLSRILEKIEKGEGTIGKLLVDKDVQEKTVETIESIKGASKEAERILKRISGFRTYWMYEQRYNYKDKLSRNDFGIMIKPKKTKFYYFGVSNIKDNGSGEDVGGEKINAFEAKIGSRVKNFTFYGGLIRGVGGAGLIFHPLKRFDIEILSYYFSKEKPFVDLRTRISLSKLITLHFGGENILNRGTFSFGLNLNLEDEDIGYLFGLGSLAGAVRK